MAYKEPTGIRKPMSEETRGRIAEAVRAAAAKKRIEQGLPPISQTGPNNPPPSYIERPLELIKMRDQNFPPDLFIPMKTGKPVDFVFTEEGGVPKACNFMLIGDPGVGKCVVGDTTIKIRIDSTGEILDVPISDIPTIYEKYVKKT